MRRTAEDRTADIAEMYRATIHSLYRFVARRTGRSRQLAEDVTQETYLRAVAEWSDGRTPEQPLAWLQTVARNILLNHYRRRRPEALDASLVERALATAPLEDPDTTVIVYAGLARLRRPARRLLEAFYIEGRSTRAIADELGVSERAVEGRLRRARQSLEKRLKPIMRTAEGETP